VTLPRVLLVSGYELGHAPLGIAWPLAFLRRAGYDAATLDLAVEPFSSQRAAAADVVVIATPTRRPTSSTHRLWRS
jgi:hypothetical protein